MKSLRFDRDNVFFRCVEGAHEAIMIIDRAGSLQYVNPAWVKLYGYSAEEAVGSNTSLLQGTNDGEDSHSVLWSRIINESFSHWRGRLVCQNKSGENVPVLLTINSIKEGAHVLGYMGIALDMREQSALETKALQQDRLASIGLLASGVAHEIGTPLGVVRGRAELLKLQLRDNPKVYQSLDIIITQIDRVSQLITSLLNLSRARGEVAGQCEVKSVVNEAVLLLRQKFDPLGIVYSENVADGLKIPLAHNEFEQVLINLIVNAVHAIEDAAKNGRASGHHIKVEAEEKNGKMCLSVSDTGTGIPKQNVPEIFRPFFTTKDVGEGTGLGLSICYQIIDSIGGEIHVDTTEGKGTTFHIIVPKVLA